ncbi:MAG TPA: hypothetical protein ENH94_10745 [Phycisphaerales bacterium]|nr:hypothetical protein [Phycisphaerales bacterium]
MFTGYLKNMRGFRAMLVAFLAGSAVIIAGAVYVLHEGKHIAEIHVPLADTAMEIQLEVALAHLWFEEILSGDVEEDIAVVWSHLKAAEEHIQEIVADGKGSTAEYLAQKHPEIFQHADAVCEKLKKVSAITHQRWEEKETAGPGTEIDQQFDVIFKEFVDEAGQLEAEIRKLIAEDVDTFRQMQIGFIAGSVLIAVAVVFMHNVLISKRKQAEDSLRQSEEQNRLTLDNMISGYALHEMIYDRDGNPVDYRYLDANSAFEELVGLKDPVGKTVRQLIPNIDKFWIETFGEITSTGVGKRFEKYQAEAGKWWEIAGFRVKAGQFACVFNDISKRKTSEDQRERLYKNLQAKTEELESMIYTMSHDLRSPLVNIEGYSGELVRSYNDLGKLLSDMQMPDDVRGLIDKHMQNDSLESIDFIVRSAEKMDALLAGLLRVSRMGRAVLEVSRLNMNELVEEVIKGMQYQIAERSVDVVVDDLPDCMGDRSQIGQVFSNLVDNAVKYLKPGQGGRVAISGRVDGQKSIYCIEDNGKGIHHEYQGVVFDIFHRLEPGGEVAGEGLGLTIVRRILDRHDGKVWFESGEGKGSKFYVSLPHAVGI